MCLDHRRRDRLDRGLVLLGRLARELDRVGRHASPLDRARHDALEHGHRLADRLVADAVGLELGAEAGDHLGRELTQLQLTEPRQRVAVPEVRVGAQRRALEVRARIDLPPLLDERRERLLAGVEVAQCVRALEQPQLGLEGARVADPVEGLAALRSRLVAPPHAPHGVAGPVAAASLSLLDHGPARPIGPAAGDSPPSPA